MSEMAAPKQMNTHLKPFIFFMLSGSLVSAATVVTAKERLNGTIVSQDAKFVTLRRVESEVKIPRDQIAQIFDDNGELVWSSPALVSAPNTANDPLDSIAKPSGYHQHDGFFLRLLGGYGSLSFRESPIYTDNSGIIEAKGPAGFFGLHIGLSVTENLIVYASANGYSTSDPEYVLDGKKITAATSSSIGVYCYGAGVSLYLDPLNAYISADIGSARTEFEIGGTKYRSNSDLGVNLQLGKEWWVSKDWGLGAALFYHYSSMNDIASGSVVPKITNSVFGLAFSATYN